MNAQEVILIFCLSSGILGLGINILFYRTKYKNHKRSRANTFSWLWDMGLILVVNALLNGILMHDVDVSSFGGGIGFGLSMLFFITPFFTLIMPSIWALIRFIYIKATPSKERDGGQKTPEPTLQ